MVERFEKFENKLIGKNFYTLKITKTPTRINYHNFDFEKIHDISRKLINGLSSLGNIPNRKFWNKYIEGGVRTISIIQNDISEFPSFNLNYIVYSDFDNLDVRILPQLSTRLRMIDPTLTCQLEYIGNYDISIIKEHIDFTTRIEMDSPITEKLGKKNLDLMIFNSLQRPQFLGSLFKPNKTLLL